MSDLSDVVRVFVVQNMMLDFVTKNDDMKESVFPNKIALPMGYQEFSTFVE